MTVLALLTASTTRRTAWVLALASARRSSSDPSSWGSVSATVVLAGRRCRLAGAAFGFWLCFFGRAFFTGLPSPDRERLLFMERLLDAGAGGLQDREPLRISSERIFQ